MASSYLDLYTTEGGVAYGGALGSSTFVKQSDYRPPTYGQNTQNMGWQAGENQRVVHDTLNNKYYGTQDKDTLTQGLTDSIARLQGQLEKGGQDVWKSGWLGHGGGFEFNNFTAKEVAERNATVKSQQSYLANMGNYKQEANTFFDSYDAYTSGWDNVYTARYNNTVRESNNAKQAAANIGIKKQNEATRKQNEKYKQIAERNDRVEARNKRQESQGNQTLSTGYKGIALPKSSNLTIGTGMNVESTKLADALLKDNGLSL